MRNKINFPNTKLGIGPLSSEIIEAVFIYSQENEVPLMLIASKNQIDNNGGYVNNWNTKKYTNHVKSLKIKYPKSKVLICRDHCGPGFNGNYDLNDTYQTIKSDITNGFDLIHFDLCKYKGSHQEKLSQSRKAIEYALSLNSNLMIEVGTDENTGRNLRDLSLIENDIKFFLTFCRPEFYVSQTGSYIMEINQLGKFDSKYVKQLKKLLDKYGLKLKEHNADYLPTKDIRKRLDLVDAVNVAPQFGVIQTQLTLLKCATYGIDPNKFLNASYKSKKWQKWIRPKNDSDKFLCALSAGHYNFTSTEYRRIYYLINKHEDFKSTIINEVQKNINMYIKSLEN